MSANTTPTAVTESTDLPPELAEFDRTTSRWGRLTMLAAWSSRWPGRCTWFSSPAWMSAPASCGRRSLAVAAAFVVIWLVEPLTYFPILGPAAMYQAFMIGNISNKLLPLALVAQTHIGAKPGTRRGDWPPSMAICGAAAVHLVSLLVFVGLLGTWLISVIPTEVIDVARLYILPSVHRCRHGAGHRDHEAAAHHPDRRRGGRAGPVRPAAAGAGIAFLATAIAVVATIVVTWLARDRNSAAPSN